MATLGTVSLVLAPMAPRSGALLSLEFAGIFFGLAQVRLAALYLAILHCPFEGLILQRSFGIIFFYWPPTPLSPGPAFLFSGVICQSRINQSTRPTKIQWPGRAQFTLCAYTLPSYDVSRFWHENCSTTSEDRGF